MTFKCLCGEEFKIGGEDSVIPGHKNSAKQTCSGSNKTVKDIRLIMATDCPLTTGHDYYPFCQTTPCLTKDQDVVNTET